MLKEITTEKTLSNNKALRSISDWLDEKGFKGTPRALTHSMYHVCIGTAKLICFNLAGSRCEFKRAREQLRRVGNSPHRLNKKPESAETASKPEEKCD